MTQQNNGGPAYPQVTADGITGGISLRDHFAIHALSAMSPRICEHTLSKEDLLIKPARLSAWAYTYADAMLAARETK